MKPTLIFILTFFVASFSSGIAQETTAARYLYFQPSPRANAMGGAAVAMEHSSFEGYNNPALLGFAPKFSLAGSWQNPLPIMDRNHIYAMASYSLDTEQAVSLSANIYTEGTHFRIFENGSVGAKYNSNSALLSATYARVLNRQLSIGASVGLLKINLTPDNSFTGASGTTTSLLFNAGVLYRNLITEATYTDLESDTANKTSMYVHKGISVGMSLSNIGPKIGFKNLTANDAPSVLTIGAAYSPIRTDLIGVQVALDLEKRLYDDGLINRIHTGCEVNILRYVCLRAGYNAGATSSESSYFTLGGGVSLPFAQLNVARYTKALLPTWQFSASFFLE